MRERQISLWSGVDFTLLKYFMTRLTTDSFGLGTDLGFD